MAGARAEVSNTGPKLENLKFPSTHFLDFVERGELRATEPDTANPSKSATFQEGVSSNSSVLAVGPISSNRTPLTWIEAGA